jgi:hypothetical protein
VDDQRILIGPARPDAEGAVVFVLELVLSAFDVGHAVRSPQALESVRDTGEVKVVGNAGIVRISCACVLLHGAVPFR